MAKHKDHSKALNILAKLFQVGQTAKEIEARKKKNKAAGKKAEQ